jgi:hypothetical protein
MQETYRLFADEMTGTFLNGLQDACRNKEIEITVREGEPPAPVAGHEEIRSGAPEEHRFVYTVTDDTDYFPQLPLHEKTAA